MQLYLFGSVARGTDNEDSDIDVVVFNCKGAALRELITRLKEYALEAGGKLDLFVPMGNRFCAVYDPGRVIVFSRVQYWLDIKKDMKPVDLDDLIAMLEEKNKRLGNSKHKRVL